MATRLNTGRAPTFRYSATGLSSGQTVAFRRQVRSARVWKTIQTLKTGMNRSIPAPVLSNLGVYPYRVAIPRGTTVVKVSSTVPAYMYGVVPVSTLCGAAYCETTDGVITVNDHIFATAISGWTIPPNWDAALEMTQRTSCRTITLRFAEDTQSVDMLTVTRVRVIQSATDAQYGTSYKGEIGAMTARLDGSPFTVGVNTDNDYTLYLNGSARCYTADGSR